MSEEPGIGRNVARGHGNSSHQAPAEMVKVVTTTNMGTVSFEGAEDADVLFAAASWLRGHPNPPVVHGINFIAQYLCPNDACEPPDHTSLSRLDLTVEFDPAPRERTTTEYLPGLG